MFKAIGRLFGVVSREPLPKGTGGDVAWVSDEMYQDLLDKCKQHNKSVDQVFLDELESQGIKPSEDVRVITPSGTYRIR
jgi:hypothetical protein